MSWFKTPEQLQEEQLQSLQQSIENRAQERLDSFAETRGYAGIMSLCTYATSSTPRFATEGQYGVEIRDATWSKLYDILEEVKTGLRGVPTSYEDIEDELPILEWPE